MLRIVLPVLTALSVLSATGCNKSSGGDSSPTPTPTPDSTAAPETSGTIPLDGGEKPAGEPEGTAVDPSATPGTTPTEGGAVVAEPEPVPVEPPPPPPTELRIKENQFWIHKRVDGALVFNTPWDEEEGDGIIRDENAVPAYAKRCLQSAENLYNALAATSDFKTRMKPLLDARVSPDLTFLVTVTDSVNDRSALRRLDRDAYFWYWTDAAKRPVVSLNQYQKGGWVWEVIATPSSCTQPNIPELRRFLDWSTRRVAEKGANP
ncbi:MAG: hypothetical protein EOP10_00645 [Proteobacteria bacterium]|nr:MAG: hypothetical protein EOP10_00645 [Pseudomonadota bacterium]